MREQKSTESANRRGRT